MSRNLIEQAARGLRASRDYTPRQRRDHDFIFGELVPQGLCALDELRALLIEADAFISHMVYRGSWPGDRYEVERLIGRLRANASTASDGPLSDAPNSASESRGAGGGQTR